MSMYRLLQMLRKSVETRDWLHTIEPRTVRAVMKRVVEDISAIDATVALLYEDQGTTTEHSSDSSRKTHRYNISVIIFFQGLYTNDQIGTVLLTMVLIPFI